MSKYFAVCFLLALLVYTGGCTTYDDGDGGTTVNVNNDNSAASESKASPTSLQYLKRGFSQFFV